jgi:predicted membrane-bound mannosyltransferase
MIMDASTILMIQLAVIVVGAIVGFLVYKDAKARGMNAVLWGILSFLLFPIVPLIYLFARRPRNRG